MSEVIAEYWGLPSEWIDSGLGYKRTNSDIFSQYVDRPGEGQRQEFNKNIDTSPAFWGWNKDCSWSTKHERSINNGTVQDVYANPENSAPVMGWYMGGSGSDAYIESKYTLNPRYRFAYDNMGDFGEHANYTAGDAYMAIGSIDSTAVGYSWAWTDIEWGKYIALPRISLYKIDNGEFVQLSDKTLTGTDSGQNTLQDYLDDGYVPMIINMGAMYWGSDLTGTTPRDSIGLDYGRLQTLVGMSPIKLTQDMYNYYSTHLDGIYETSKYWIQPDYGHNLEIYQAPFTLFSNGNWQIIDTVEGGYGSVSALYRGEQVIGMCVDSTVGAYNSGLKAVAYKACTTVQQFDDVSYHWETDVFSEGNDANDTIYTYTKLVIDNYDSEKWEDEAHAYFGAILHECAYFGMKFASTESLARTGNIGSTGDGIGLYLPIFTDQMHTTGLYKTAQEFVDDDNVDNDSARDFDFDPDVPVPDEPGEDVPGGKTGDWSYNKGDFTLPNNMQYFVLGNQTFSDFSAWCKDTYEKQDDPDHVQHSNLEWNGIDCTDWVTTVKYYPFNVPKTNDVYPIKVGFINATRYDIQQDQRVDITAPLYKYDTSDCTYKLGSFVLDANFLGKNFRGTALAKVWLKLPFYGDFELDLGRYFDTTVSIELLMDFITGTGCYMIYADDCMFDTVDVHIGSELPLTGYNMGTYQNNMRQLDEQLRMTRWNRTVGVAANIGTMIGGAVTGQYLAVGTAGANMVANLGSTGIAENAIDYKLHHTSPTGGQCSTASAFCGLVQDLRVRVITARPKCQDGYSAEHPDRKSSYAKTVGYACVKSGKLNSFTGLTVCSGYNASSISCTGAERELIASALNSGVIV